MYREMWEAAHDDISRFFVFSQEEEGGRREGGYEVAQFTFIKGLMPMMNECVSGLKIINGGIFQTG